MIIDTDVVTLSRLQFALTALYHFLFVPLTLGLVWMLAIMESVYVMTGREVWKRMVQFWGVLFGINFAMGVATGVTMEFQFGMNWAYYSHYVGDVFGAPLAIEGLMAFFLEATLVGVFFMGWERISRIKHMLVTWFLALGTSLSALWILVANAWMQHPVGAAFNPQTMRMEVTSFSEVLFNPVAQDKFVHTVSAGYVMGAMFVLSISAWYLLRGRNVDFAKRSMTVAASFGLAAALSVVVLGDASGYTVSLNQKMKMAAIEAMWHTEPAPASFTLVGIPDVQQRTTHFAVKIPWVMGLIGTHSTDQTMPGIAELVDTAKGRIGDGIQAYDAMLMLRQDKDNAQAKATLAAHDQDLGYALLLKKYVDFLRMRLGGLLHEEFHVLWLDNRHRILDCQRLFTGTIDGASVYPREVVRAALSHNASAVILVHNHPSGVAEPSASDRAITRELKEALDLVGVRVLDHVVVGETCVSLASRGLV